MDKETAEKAKKVLADIAKMEEIKDAMREESSHWWAFISPDTKRRDGEGLVFPEMFRKEFSLAVENTVAKLEQELDQL